MAQTNNNNLVRLNKYIASQSKFARRQADDLISRGHVVVNGKLAKLGDKVDPDSNPDVIVNGKRIDAKPAHYTYVMLNKPKGYVVTRAQFENEQSVMELLPESLQHVRPVGRLDKNSEGLVLFTDDGDLIQQLTHPSYQHEKEYWVGVKYPLRQSDFTAWSKGVKLEEGNTGRNDSLEQIDEFQFKIVLKQGWNRQIRRMVELRNNRVRALLRTRVGHLTLGNLPEGKWQIIKREEIVD